MKRILSGLLVLVMISSLFMPVLAVRTLPEHEHDESCFLIPGTPELVCNLEEAHEHSADCYAHELVCELSEDGHVHDDSCYGEPVLVCTQKEHQHDVVCYGDLVQVCELNEHAHDETCYDENQELVCGQEAHSHGDVCYESGELVCGMEEHIHDDMCYEQGELICHAEEQQAHVHDETCYDATLVCGLLQAHTHDETCYDADGVLICDKTERPVHEHTDSCYELVDSGYSDVPLCGLEETEPSDSILDDLGNIVDGLLTPGDAADYELVVHAVDVNDTEVYTESISVSADETVAEALADNVLSDESGVFLADCGWYDADGESVDISSVLSGNMDIWTYQRMIGLTVGLDFYSVLKWDSAESVTADDFMIDGTNFDAAYSWYDDETYDTVYLSDFVGQFLTSNIYLTTPDVEVPCYDVYYHDIGPDGEELPGTADVLVSDYLPEGSTLQEWGGFVLEDYWGDTAEEGGILVGDCVWYREDGSVFDTVTGEEHIYTHSYTLTLVTDDGRLTLTAREGFPIDASRLIIDGIDYGAYSYQDDAGNSINMSQLLASGLTGSLTLTQIPDEPDRPVENITVNHYVYLNGVKTKVATTTQAYGPDTENFSGRYYFTLDQLAEIYGPYGFQSDAFSGQLIFPHTDAGSNTIWANASPVYDTTGTWLIPIGNSRVSFDMYYFPNNVPGSSTYFSTSASLRQSSWGGTQQDTAMTKSNYLYQVQVTDPDGLFEDFEDESHYVLSGHDLSLTVPYRTGVAWIVSGNMDTVRELNDDETELTIHISNIKSAFSVTACEGFDEVVDAFRIVYDTEISPVTMSANILASIQSFTEPFTVNSVENYSDAILDTGDETVYSFKSPDSSFAVAEASLQTGVKYYYYIFDSWLINGSVKVQPGDEMTLRELKAYAVDDTVTVTPSYHVKDINERMTSLNFYVCLNCEIMDTSGSGYNPHPAGNFTASVYGTPIYGTDRLSGGNDLNYQLVAAENEDIAYDVDRQIRALANVGIDGITVGSVPTDEEVLRTIRESGAHITMDGVTLSSDILTPDNFSVRWYVVKYDNSDGWHIDGVLVARAGKFVVTKTFIGDEEAIESVKDNYAITVSHDDVTDYTLRLYPGSLMAGDVGYTSYDEVTDTYTWVLDVRQGITYQLLEQNYIAYPLTQWLTTAEYRISNAESVSSVIRDYTDDGVFVQGLTYASDAPVSSYETVSFMNQYAQSGMLAFHKVDNFTGNGMSGVSFYLTDAQGQDVTVFRKPGTDYYSAQSDAISMGYTEPVTDGILTTNSNGYFWIELSGGTYQLHEVVPMGYDAAYMIEIVVAADGTVISSTAGDSSTGLMPDGGWVEIQNGGTTLLDRNQSKLLTTVRVEKDWGETDISQPVTVELWRNGAKLTGDEYTVVLNESNGWSYEWHDLPLFTDQALTEYTVHERRIGSTDYDGGADTDGYRDYQVTVDDVLYREDDGILTEHGYWMENDGMHYANYALIRIHNRETTGVILFQKTDVEGTPLAGAMFGLYADAGCTQLLEEATSDSNGKVEFMNHAAGTYYLRELSAPVGYVTDDTVYTIQISGGQAKILNQAGDVVTKLVNEESDFLLDELPHTGSVSMLVCMVCGGTSLMVGLLLCSGKKKRI